MKSTNLLLDSWSTQVLYQRKPPSYPAGVKPGNKSPNNAPDVTGMRLNTLFGAIQSAGQSGSTWKPDQPWKVSFTTPPIDAAQLKDMDVYISLTRFQHPPFAYTNSELKAIQKWVEGGGNVLLMTNHGPTEKAPDDDWTVNDAPLAQLFGVKLENYFVQGSSKVMSICDPVSGNAPTMMAHDACIIVPPSGVTVTTIAVFPPDWKAWSKAKGTIDPPHPYFALLVPYNAKDAGKLLLVGNSGWLGDEGSPKPAQGLAPHQHNLQFALNCIGYLAGLTYNP